MKMRCLNKSIVRGDIVKRGDILDLTKEECAMDVIKANFVKVSEDESASTAPAVGAVSSQANTEQKTVLVAGLTREQAMMKLQQAGAKMKRNMSNAALVDLYNATFANLTEAVTAAQ